MSAVESVTRRMKFVEWFKLGTFILTPIIAVGIFSQPFVHKYFIRKHRYTVTPATYGRKHIEVGDLVEDELAAQASNSQTAAAAAAAPAATSTAATAGAAAAAAPRT